MGSTHRVAKNKASIKKKILLCPHFEYIFLFQSIHSTITAVKLQVQGSFVWGLCTKLQDTGVAHILQIKPGWKIFENSENLHGIFTKWHNRRAYPNFDTKHQLHISCLCQHITLEVVMRVHWNWFLHSWTGNKILPIRNTSAVSSK